MAERVAETLALSHAPGEIAGGDLGIVLGLELQAGLFQFAAQRVVIGQRAVVHEALIAAGREWVGAAGVDGGFGCHARVRDRM